jgi:HlyD family secretion protein
MTARKTLISSFVAILLAGAAFAAFSGGAFSAGETAEPQAAATPAPPSIRVVAAKNRELVEALSVTGTIVARDEAAAGTDLNGLTVTELNADKGDYVRKGDILARLDRSSLDTQLAEMDASRAQAEASIAQAQAQIGDAEVGVRKADEALQRARALQEKGVAAKSQLDNAVNAYDSAKAQLLSAQKAVASAEAQLGVIDAQRKNVLLQIDKTEVKAPADGLILARSATLGGVVSASGGPLFRIAINGEFELAATVAETALASLEPGMPVKVTVAGARSGIGGRIRLLSPEVNQSSRLGMVHVSLAKDAHVRAGNFARGVIEIARHNGVAVPASALVYRGPEAFLQVVENGKVRTLPVRPGIRDGTDVEIVSGLSEGQEVVARAGTFVADGDHVTPIRDEQTGALER